MVIKRMLGATGIILCCAIPAYAGSPKPLDKLAPPPDLILTLPDDQWLAEEKAKPLTNSNMAARNNNETQAFAVKKVPVNVKCDVDVIQNTVNEVPLSNRLFGECDLHYHY